MINFHYLCDIHIYTNMVRVAIKEKMKVLGITNKELCAKLGMYMSNFSAFLSGKRGLPHKDLVRVMVELQISIGNANQPRAMYPATMMHEVIREEIKHSTKPLKDISDELGIDNCVLSSFISGNRKMALRHIENLMQMFNLKVLNAA